MLVPVQPQWVSSPELSFATAAWRASVALQRPALALRRGEGREDRSGHKWVTGRELALTDTLRALASRSEGCRENDCMCLLPPWLVN
mmetsp:Transcript_36397/g.77514  ORF Transcript_36397/g.77514 Transcript_36397/m.77514 type:complete len:87 (+) Transcript_36397:364-624(+)